MNKNVRLENRVVLSDEVINDFIDLFEIARDTQFAIGDRLIELVALYNGNVGGVINALAGELRISPSTLYDYHRVAVIWKPAFREEYQSLDWTVYRNSNPNDPIDRHLLDQAVDDGWTATRFKEEKYPSMRKPSYIFDRIKAIIKRAHHYFDGAWQAELDDILERIERLEDEYEASIRQKSG